MGNLLRVRKKVNNKAGNRVGECTSYVCEDPGSIPSTTHTEKRLNRAKYISRFSTNHIFFIDENVYSVYIIHKGKIGIFKHSSLMSWQISNWSYIFERYMKTLFLFPLYFPLVCSVEELLYGLEWHVLQLHILIIFIRACLCFQSTPSIRPSCRRQCPTVLTVLTLCLSLVSMAVHPWMYRTLSEVSMD